MKSKNLSEKILRSVKSKGFKYIQLPSVIETNHIVQRSGENFRKFIFSFTDQKGNELCLRPDLTIVSCLRYLENNFKGNKKLLHMIHLPIPRNVTDTQGVQYGEGSLNPLEALGTSLVSAGFSPNQPIDKLKNALNATLNKGNEIFKDAQTQNIVGATISGSLIGALGGNVTTNQLISRATGQVLNPNLELLFNGVGLRVFPFSFQFFPRNRTEGIEVMNIIKTLKYEMAPSRNRAENALEGIFIGAPSIFQLRYMKGADPHPFLNKFLPTFLSDLKVNYTASGAHSTFYDGTPTHIQVDMQFKEINPIFKEDYEDSKGGVGY